MKTRRFAGTIGLALALGACGTTTPLADRIVYTASDAPFPQPAVIVIAERSPQPYAQRELSETQRLEWLQEREEPRYLPPLVTAAPVQEVRFIERDCSPIPWLIPLGLSLSLGHYDDHWSYGVGFGHCHW